MINSKLKIINLNRDSDIGNIRDILSEIIGFLNKFTEDGKRLNVFIDGENILSVKTENFDGRIGTFHNQNLYLFTHDTERVAITSDGLVGIGTTSPEYDIHLKTISSANATFVAERTGGAKAYIGSGSTKGFVGTKDSSPLRLVVNDSWRVEISESSGETVVNINSMKTLSSHPTNYRAVYQNTDTGELYKLT